MIRRVLLYILSFIFRKDVFQMAMAYAILIINGKKSFSDVPDRLKPQVAEILRDLDCGYLAED